MGILDDAIRQHLELKRQHGADDTDLERLEQEAFGPATRPGDPEFETGSEPAIGRDDDEPIADFDSGDSPSEAATTVAPQVGGDPSAPDAGPPSSAPEPDPLPPPSAEPAAGERPPEPSPAEQARVEHPHLADTVDHPALDPLPPAEGTEGPAAAAGPEPVEAPEGSIFFDQEAADEEATRAAEAPPAELEPVPGEEEIEEVAFEDFEIDLEQPSEGAPPAEEAPFAGGEPAVTQVPFEPASGEAGEADDDFELDIDLDDEPFDEAPSTVVQPPAPGSAPPDPASEIEFDLDEELEDDIEDEDEDLLEETPDFLQDAPEGERLWFEQGEPKDFDFDED